MRTFIVTQAEAGRLPRWALAMLGVLYVVPGLIARDPWGRADAEGFGLALTMARGGLNDWLAPHVLGLALPAEGPLAPWIGAAVASLFAGVLTEHAAVRLATGLVVALGLACVWHGTYLLARRAEVQPADPFGASASRDDIGRALADAALLVTMASCGLIARVHETTAEATQFAWSAAFLLGTAQAIERPLRGGLIAAVAIAASLLTRGIPTAAFMLIVLLALPLCSPRYRLISRTMLGVALPVSIALSVAWPLLLLALHPAGAPWLQAWLDWNAGELGWPNARALIFLARNLPWFLWPTWPLALWAAWHWRHRWREPALTLPLLMGASALAMMLLSPAPSESVMLAAVLPVALLAALGLPTVKRRLVSLLDWVAVATFSLFGFVLWAYWLALQTGFPPRMAVSAARLAPGHQPESIALQAATGVLASLAWLGLVSWRISRRPQAFWRPMALSCGGLVLIWLLLQSLWLPVYDARKSYRNLASDIAATLPPDYDCVTGAPLDAAQRANFAYFGGIRFGREGQSCTWLLTQEDVSHRVTRLPEGVWQRLWQGRRPFDPGERFTLYRLER